MQRKSFIARSGPKTGRRFNVNPAVKTYVNKRISANKQLNETISLNAAQNVAYDGVAMINLTSGIGLSVEEKIEILNIKGRCLLNNPASAGAVFVRMVAFQWYPDNNVEVPDHDDVLERTASAEADLCSKPEPDTFNGRHKGKLLLDRTYRLGETTSVEGTDKKFITFNINQKDLGRKFAKGTGSNVGLNNVYIMLTSNIADASTPPTAAVYAGVNYKLEAGHEQ